MKIYISGGITGVKNYKERFARAAAIIEEKGHEAINPCDIQAIFKPGTTSWEQYMMVDKGMLQACAAVYFLPGWEKSKGSRIEHKWAIEFGLKIYTALEAIRRAE